MATKLKTPAKTIVKPESAPQRKSNAQRQADYRLRHLKDESAQFERLSLLVDLHAKRALERLACCYGVTQRAMLERLLLQADQLAQEHAARESPNGQAHYFDRQIRLQWHAVTG